ncbi:hypothetical protein H0H92_012137 [Tricholoma furcatifolium]|nr:hypothetical protein H0H92_012137 [Tricholoma furcatifolium]
MSPRTSVDKPNPRPPTPPPTPPFSPLSKGKQREIDLGQYDDDFRDPEPVPSPSSPAYPPTNDDVEETRRIEANLRQWDAVERRRRKSARESTQATTSLVGDVTRTASLLWSSKRSGRKPDPSLGNHVALQSQENINDLNTSTNPSPSRETDLKNPFANPPEHLSPFADPLQSRSTMSSTSSSDSPSASPLLQNLSSDTSTYPMDRSAPGPPMPLGLPPPRTPPPFTMSPNPVSPPSTSVPSNIVNDELQETRWWHDWLCGCSEGPDRGGDYQAGRTNPFE